MTVGKTKDAAEEREAQRAHWQVTLDRLEAAVGATLRGSQG